MEENMNQVPQEVQQPTQNKGAGLSVASMVLGIVAVVFNCCFYYVSLPCGIVGLILGIVSLKKKKAGRGMAIAGVVLSAVSLVLFVILTLTAGALLAALPWAELSSGTYTY